MNDQFDPDAVDPLDGHGHVEFDFDAIDKSLHPHLADIDERDVQASAAALRRILIWLTSVLKNPRARGTRRSAILQSVGHKTVALAWLVDPTIVSGQVSQRDIANSLGLNPTSMSKNVKAAADVFGITNRARIASKGWGRNKARKAQ